MYESRIRMEGSVYPEPCSMYFLREIHAARVKQAQRQFNDSDSPD